jgi:hypothetical protein
MKMQLIALPRASSRLRKHTEMPGVEKNEHHYKRIYFQRIIDSL